jgi:hypothetical protein
MTGDLRSTFTLSFTAATSSTTFTVAVKPTPTWMPSRLLVLKPPSTNSSEYSLGGSAGNR